MVITLRE